MSRKSQDIFQTLQEDIILGVLHPKERLIEQELVERFDSSRPVVREALRELQKIGLVQLVPNKGASVVALFLDEITEIYQVRIELEALAAGWIALPLPEAVLDELCAIQHAHGEAIAKRDFRAIFMHNNAFHEALNRQCGNRHLQSLIQQMAERAILIRYSAIMEDQYLEKVRADHHRILDALKRNDRQELVEAVRLHNARGLDWYRDHSKSRPR